MADAEQAGKVAVEAKAKAEESKKMTDDVTAQVKKQLGSATQITKNVQSLSERVSELEKQTSAQMRGSGERIDARVAELDKKIDAASNEITAQQKKLTKTDELVKAMYSSKTTEYFPTQSNSSNIVIVPLKTKGALVLMLLKSVPIPESVDLKWRVFDQPHGSYFILNGNALFFSWGDPADSLKEYPLEVTYVPDATSAVPSFKSLSVKNGAAYGDDTKLMDLPISK